MKKIGIIAAIAAIICGFFVYTFVSDIEKKEAARMEELRVETVQLVYAATEIPPFTDITAEMLVLKDFPTAYAPSNGIKTIEEVVGKRCDGTLYAGQMIVSDSLKTSEDIGTSMSFQVPEGMRAMTISVSGDAGVGGYLTAGDLVDIKQFIYTQIDENDKQTIDTITTDSGIVREISGGVTATVLQGVEILALGNNGYTSESGELYSSVTLVLTPEQCDILLAARETGGDLTLTLRHRGSGKAEYDSVSTVTELFD